MIYWDTPACLRGAAVDILPTDTNNVQLKFWDDIQSQTKVTVQKQEKNPIWPTGIHFKSVISEKQ